MASKDLTDLQAELALARAPEQHHVALPTIWKQKSASAAFVLACNVSGLEDKEIYVPLKIDAGHFARIKKGDAGFPPDKLSEFCVLVGNRIYLEWQAHQVGCGLVLLKSEAERQLDVERVRADAAEQALRTVLRSMQGSQV
jgi:hypothetical protein